MDDIADAMSTDHVCEGMPLRHVVTPGVAAKLTGVERWRIWSALRTGRLKRYRHRSIAHNWCVNIYEMERVRDALMRRPRPKRYAIRRRWK